ncbi:MAG: polysaccharide biosynthesis/export family protein [Candidatus Acidiferrales bacterium]
MKKTNAILIFGAVLVFHFTACVAIAGQQATRIAPSPLSVSNAGGRTSSASLASTPDDSDRPALQTRNPRYQICKGDLMDLNFPITPEFNQTVTVQPDGYVTLIGAGDVHVEAQTVPQLTETIRAAYSKILHDPIVSITLKDFNKPYFVVAGEVGHPGKFDLRGDTTVVEAVAIAGGFTPNAKNSQVLLFRRASSEWYEVTKVNVKQLLNAKNLQEDMHLRPGDMLYVPKSLVGRVSRFVPQTGTGAYFRPF